MSRKAAIFALISMGLLGLYALTGYLALNPNTSESYRAYFIDRTREVMDDDGSFLRPVNPGQWITHDSNDVGYIGFSGVEPEFRWSSGKKVSVLIKAVCGPDWQDIVKIKLSSNGVQHAAFALNGSALVSETVQPDQPEIDLHFPDGTLKCGDNRLDIALPDARAPSASDSRELGLAVRAVTIE